VPVENEMKSASEPPGGRLRCKLTLVGAFLGLACGLLEGALYNLFQHWRLLSFTESLISVQVDQLWISAGVNFLLFSAAGLAADAARLLAAKRFGSKAGALAEQAGYTLLGILAAYDLVHLSGRLHKVGSLVIACGIGYQFGNWLIGRESKQVWMRRALPALFAGVLLAACGVYGYREIRERNALANLPQLDAPNILLLDLDTVRQDRLGVYGNPGKLTPNMDRLAMEGGRFERAYAASSWTLPSHATMFTGLPSYVHRATGRGDWLALDGRHPVLADVLRRRGYATGGFVANTLWASPWTGLNFGFIHYESIYFDWDDSLARTFYGRVAQRTVRPLLFGAPTRPRPMAPELHESFLSWLQSDVPARRPFFAWINYMEAHDPPVTIRYYRQLRPETARAAPAANRLEEYDRAILLLDAEIARLLERLSALGMLDNTIVILTSDHGELFSETGYDGHGNSLHNRLLHVPLILRFPRSIKPGARVAREVSHADLPATLMDLAGLGDSPFSGASLVKLLDNPDTALETSEVVAEIDGAKFDTIPEKWPVRKGWLKTIFVGRWQGVLHEDGSTELYDVLADPDALSDLDQTPEGKQIVAALLERLQAALKLSCRR
jgi:arylsulfatase A-like enzyme